MGGGDGPDKLDRIETVEVLKEKEKESWAWVHNKIIKPEPKVKFGVL